jgi:hypothetical protein
MSLSGLQHKLEMKTNHKAFNKKKNLTNYLFMKDFLIKKGEKETREKEIIIFDNNTIKYVFLKKFIEECILQNIISVIEFFEIIFKNQDYIDFIEYFKNYIPFNLFKDYYERFIEQNEFFQLTILDQHLHSNQEYIKYYNNRNNIIDIMDKKIINISLKIIQSFSNKKNIFNFCVVKIKNDFPDIILYNKDNTQWKLYLDNLKNEKQKPINDYFGKIFFSIY